MIPVTRLHPKSVCIYQDYDMLGLYDRIWIRVIQCTKGNRIRTVVIMGLWKHSFPFRIPENIIMGADDFSRVFRNNFQYTFLIPVHVVASGNHKDIRNKWFICYLNKVQKIN